ncbi:sulfatase-like hydrolase/transferase [Winogradskyella sp.]|jgi:arylsulfatase A-like enzyme|nr:sulfatase-like hydrolase/transferase [Winogradskyella sp.]MDB4752530.1 sulfatase-like hydrolase/transferase [Winogradskyella sp.]
MKYLIGYIVLMLIFFQTTQGQSSSKQPMNIIWISVEDMGPILGAYGNKIVNTPNINRLAQEGIKYTNAYATVGVCAPSRFSIITGMYPARIGAHNMRTGDHNNFKWPEDIKLRQNKGITDRLNKNIPDYEVVTPNYVKPFSEYLRAEGYYCVNDDKCDYQFNAPFTAWDDVYGGGSYKNAPVGTPFFYVKNYYTTHESRIWMRKNKPMTVSPEEVLVPDYYPDIPIVRNDIARKYSNIEALDQEIGLLLKQLESDKVLNSSVIFFWSDHGGNLLRQKRAVGDSGLHVPLIIRYPDGYRAGETENRLVSLMDLGPTVMSLIGIKPPSYMDGKAFAGAYEESPRKFIYGTADRFDESTDMQRSVLDGRFVYIKNFIPEIPLIYRNKYREQIPMNKYLIELDSLNALSGDDAYIFMKSKPIEELYDLKNDPYEVNNLALDINYKDKLEELRKKLSDWQLDIKDKGFIPESEIIRSFWPNMKQPKTDDVIIYNDAGNISLSCQTKGASIGYQLGENFGTKHWQLYKKPFQIKPKEKIRARAIRIGYKASNISSN